MCNIKNINDVKSFFQYLYDERKVDFHPDESFDIYISRVNGRQTFTPEECIKFDRLMDECFTVCETCGNSIYEIADDVFNTVYHT